MIAAKSRDKKSLVFIFLKKKNQAFMHLFKSKDLKASRIWHQTPFKNGVARELPFFRHPSRPRTTKTAAACWQQPFKIW